MGVGSMTVVKWVAAGAVAAAVAGLGLFSGVGTPLVQGLVLMAIGIGILFLIGPKKLGAATALPAGLIVAGGVVLSNQYIVPMLPSASAASGSG